MVYLGVKEAGRNRETECQMQPSSHTLCHTSPHVDSQGLNHGDHFLSQSPIFIDKEFEAQYVHALLSLAQFFLFKRKVWPLFKVVSE